MIHLLKNLQRASDHAAGAALTALLIVQALTQFVVIPLCATHPYGRLLLDLSHLGFTAICVVAMTQHLALRMTLFAGLILLATFPALDRHFGTGLDPTLIHQGIALVALTFNVLVTALIARHVLGPGRVTTHRVWGAVLLYLNVSAIFAIIYGLLLTHDPVAIVSSTPVPFDPTPGARMAQLTYFSLATLTTAGYGDLVPVHPMARSLANLESIIGQLFPATLLARLVALHLSHQQEAPGGRRRSEVSAEGTDEAP